MGINEINWNLFWPAFGAIGGTLGAFATAAAVIVALWQTKYSQKKKLKLSFSDDIAVVPQTGSNISRFVGVTLTNIGNREIVIKNWGFIIDKSSSMMIVPGLSPIDKILQVQLPHKLALEESISLYFEKVLFINAISENCTKSKVLNENKIKFYVTDSTGRKFFVKTAKKAHEYCNK